QHGGKRPAITDADLMLGKLDPDNFAGGKIKLSLEAARDAVVRDVGAALDLAPLAAAFGICEVVDENMANAARVHAVENGKNISDNVMIAFGGAAPLHAARLCEKLGVGRCLIPQGAGVGSAIGFLKAPFGYEALASKVTALSRFDAAATNSLLDDLKATAARFVRRGSDAALEREVTAFMRYAGQGWEIPVALPDRPFGDEDKAMIEESFRARYAQFFGRAVEGPEIEFVTWSVRVQDTRPAPPLTTLNAAGETVEAAAFRSIFDPTTGRRQETAIFARDALKPAARVAGPAVIVEQETATVVTTPFDAVIQDDGSILLLRKGSAA
ncbi:MAG TPA: hydantoinase/oxoprolinase family protein, partial [Kiloniellaceae bacterium]|nr:hydantoinase/oxoprolinase family protein [Kiloniellaceae bacterium]